MAYLRPVLEREILLKQLEQLWEALAQHTTPNGGATISNIETMLSALAQRLPDLGIDDLEFPSFAYFARYWLYGHDYDRQGFKSAQDLARNPRLRLQVKNAWKGYLSHKLVKAELFANTPPGTPPEDDENRYHETYTYYETIDLA